jgi:hypothetical protein
VAVVDCRCSVAVARDQLDRTAHAVVTDRAQTRTSDRAEQQEAPETASEPARSI